MKPNIINNFRKYLVEKNIYNEGDEITLLLFENSFCEYQKAVKDVKKNGQVITTYDYNKNIKVVSNPSFRNLMELSKELYKILEGFSKRNKDTTDKTDDPFLQMMKNLNDVEKR